MGNHFIHFSKQDEIASFVVADLFFHYSSYYKKILAKQHEMNDTDGDTTEYIHDPRQAGFYNSIVNVQQPHKKVYSQLYNIHTLFMPKL